MPNFIQKSNENIDSARLLINNDMYTSSVHCAYYACLQMIKNFLCNKGVDYESQNINSSGLNSHLYLIRTVSSFLDEGIRLDYLATIQTLKRQRVIADYKWDMITKQVACDMLSCAEKIRGFLSNNC